MENLKKRIAKLWAPIAGLLGAITAIVQFIQLWQGNQETVTQVLWIGGAILIWVSLYYIGFSRSESPIRTSDTWGNQRTKQIYSYGEEFSKISRGLFFLSLLGVFILWGLSIRRNNLLNDKVVVLIADFDGPDPKNYRVTEQLLGQLSNSLSSYDDTIIFPLDKTITEQEGSKKAQDLGKNYRADLVIWGWYGVTESDVLLTVHVENLSDLKYLPLAPSNLYGIQLPAYQIKSFQIQQRLSSQLTALTLFLGGLIRYEANDHQGAIKRFSDALNEKWPDDLISRKFIFFYRGVSYYMSVFENIYPPKDGFSKAIADLSESIAADSEFWQAYYFRIMSYTGINDYNNAEKDYQLFITQAPPPTNAEDYKTFASLAMDVLDNSKAIEYLDMAIKIDPKDAISLLNRGQLYLIKSEYKVALADLNRAIEIEPSMWLFYSSRAEVYRAMGEYELALKDINQALDLHTANDEVSLSDFLLRGRIYMDMGDYPKAIDDFSNAIQISPNSLTVDSYYYRGLSYLRLKEYEKAVQDFSVFLQSNNFDDFVTPDAYYYRGVSLENLGYTEYALIDYSYADQAYAYFAKSLYDGGYIDQAEGECKRAIQNFQELLGSNKNDSIVQWANAVVKSFKSACPRSLVERVPTKNFLIELMMNPIIPSSGLAGIKIGDSADFVIDHINNAVGWLTTDAPPNIPDCCFLGIWSSENIVLTIYFTITDEKVVDFYLDGSDLSSPSEFIPLVNGVSIGTSNEELLKNWGNPISSRSTETPDRCTVIYYNGIRFRVCGKNKIIDVINIPGILLENSLK